MKKGVSGRVYEVGSSSSVPKKKTFWHLWISIIERGEKATKVEELMGVRMKLSWWSHD